MSSYRKRMDSELREIEEEQTAKMKIEKIGQKEVA